MPETLETALSTLRPLLLDADRLVRAVGAGRRRGEHPSYARAVLRPVELKAGPRLQVVTSDGRADTTHNHPYDGPAAGAVDALLEEPFGNWHVETVDETVQLRVTKKGRALVHRSAASRREVAPRTHDRTKQRLLDPADPLFDALGADADKRRQVDAFLRVVEPTVDRALRARGDSDRPLRVVDLGCGNAYLTFAAHRFLTSRAGAVETIGVDVRPDMVSRNASLADELGMTGLTFETGTILDSGVDAPVDVVLALHACDTATDEALARAVRWGAPVVLAAPCCHHDVQRQIAEGPGAPAPYAGLARHGILRERLADVLTDALRAQVLRMVGWRVDVVEFVDSRHTPRNAMLRAVHTGAAPHRDTVGEYRALTADWGVHPALARLLDQELVSVLGR